MLALATLDEFSVADLRYADIRTLRGQLAVAARRFGHLKRPPSKHSARSANAASGKGLAHDLSHVVADNLSGMKHNAKRAQAYTAANRAETEIALAELAQSSPIDLAAIADAAAGALRMELIGGLTRTRGLPSTENNRPPI